jgi:hypothetical protein
MGFGACRQGPVVLPDELPDQLSSLGLFESMDTLKPCSFMVPYEVNSPLWSDGALKQRWYIPPAGGKIVFSKDDPWIFPLGTILVKHFELQTSPSEKKTRVEHRYPVY